MKSSSIKPSGLTSTAFGCFTYVFETNTEEIKKLLCPCCSMHKKHRHKYMDFLINFNEIL